MVLPSAVTVNRDRALAVVASTGMILTWLANAATPRPEPARFDAERVAGVAGPRVDPVQEATDVLAFDVEREGERLRVRVANSPVPRPSGRDPFQFGTPRVPPPRRLARLAPMAPAVTAADPADDDPTPPIRIKLIGMAERDTPDGVVRSAVLSGPSDVYIVVIGDQLLGRFTVKAIGADAVELDDSGTGQPVRLALR
jgi:hypothetical protein